MVEQANKPEYLYARVRISEKLVEHILHRDGDNPVHFFRDDGAWEAIFTAYNTDESRKETEELIVALRILSNELNYVAEDLGRYVDDNPYPAHE